MDFVIEFKQYFQMFESKMTTRSGWGQITSINSSCAPGFIPIPCPSHQQYSITNICKATNCIEPLCPECIAGHVQLHQESKSPAKIQNIITTKTACIEQLAIMKYEAQKQIDESISSSMGNIQQFVEAHQKRLDTAQKKVIKIVDDLFAGMNKQMQVITNAYLAQKQKRQKQAKMKLSPMNDFLTRITEYKQQLQSEDYIPALIQLLNQPPRKPKYEKMNEVQNYGSVQINQKYLEDIKNDLTKFVKVIVNCKDEGFKGRVEMNKSNFNGSNNMKFSRFDRSQSRDGRDGSSSKLGESSRSNSRKKIFGCESVISNIRSSNQRIQENTIYKTLKQSSNPNSNNNSIQQVRYSSYSSPLKIVKSSYFSSNNASLWYFKQGTKNGFRVSLQSIEAGFQKIELNINFLIPQNHKTIILPNGTVLILAGELSNNQEVWNKVFRLNEQDFTLKEVQPMINARSSFGACYFQDYIYVAGGLCSEMNKFSSKRPIRQAQRYNLRQNRWQKICQLPEPAYQFSMHQFSSGKIIKFGGLTDSRVFIQKLDIYQSHLNHWVTIQPDSRFLIASSPGLTSISNESLIVFGGKIPAKNEKISKCYILTEEQKGGTLSITEGPELYNEASFESGFIHEGSIIGIQNNEINNRNKLIMGYKYDQWKFISC